MVGVTYKKTDKTKMQSEVTMNEGFVCQTTCIYRSNETLERSKVVSIPAAGDVARRAGATIERPALLRWYRRRCDNVPGFFGQ
jgi:hypothetical protein